MDDRALVEGLVAFHDAAWAQFERVLRPALLRMFTSKGVAHQDLHDCYQSFCVRLFEDHGGRLRQWRGDAKLLSWLLSIARRYAVDWVDQVNGHQRRHTSEWDDDAVDAHADPVLAPEPADPATRR